MIRWPLRGAPFVDLCVGHAGRITAPRGWELVRHAGPLPSHPDEDDLVALADAAVREGWPERGAPASSRRKWLSLHGFDDFPRCGDRSVPGGGVLAPPGAWGRAPARHLAGVARPRRLVFPCCSRSGPRRSRADRLAAKSRRKSRLSGARACLACRAAVDRVIKAYDVRGLAGEEIDESLVTDLGAASARLM